MGLIIFLYFNPFGIPCFGENRIFRGDSYLFNPAYIGKYDIAYGVNISQGFLVRYSYFVYNKFFNSFSFSVSNYVDSYEVGITYGRNLLSFFDGGFSISLRKDENILWEQKLAFLFNFDTLKTGITFLNRFTDNTLLNSRQGFEIGGKYRKNFLEFSLYTIFDMDYEWDFELGVKYYQDVFNALFSISSAVIGIGIIYSVEDIILSLSTSYNFIEATPFLIFEYKREIGLPYRKEIVKYIYIHKDAEDTKTDHTKKLEKEEKSKEQGEVKTVSREILARQEKLLKKGSKLYAREEYRKAIKVWNEVIKLAPHSVYADKAREYIKKVKKILDE